MSTSVQALFATLKATIEGLSSIQTAAVLRERLALAIEQTQLASKVVSETEAEVARLLAENEGLKKELAALRVGPQFTEHRGALFKREPSGGYAKAVYCPECKVSTAGLAGPIPFTCHRCGWASSFGTSSLDAVIAEIAP